jgi:REP element-mobilizing transposase RayT
MPSTYLSLHYHLVFSTKHRATTIADPWRARLHEYLGGTIRGLDGVAEAVGGVADHVHLLVGLKATQCLADLMRELKKASSAWVHQEIGLTRSPGQKDTRHSPSVRRRERPSANISPAKKNTTERNLSATS